MCMTIKQRSRTAAGHVSRTRMRSDHPPAQCEHGIFVGMTLTCQQPPVDQRFGGRLLVAIVTDHHLRSPDAKFAALSRSQRFPRLQVNDLQTPEQSKHKHLDRRNYPSGIYIDNPRNSPDTWTETIERQCLF